jgi:hypothetical protein
MWVNLPRCWARRVITPFYQAFPPHYVCREEVLTVPIQRRSRRKRKRSTAVVPAVELFLLGLLVTGKLFAYLHQAGLL